VSKCGYLDNNWYMFKLIWKICPSFILAEILWGIFSGITTSIQALFIKVFYDGIQNRESFIHICIIIFGMLGVILITNYVRSYYTKVVKPVKIESYQQGLTLKLFDIAQKVDLSVYDQASFYDNMTWSMSQGAVRGVKLLETLSSIVKSSMCIFTIAALFFEVNPILSLVAIMASFFSMFLQKASAKLQAENEFAKNKHVKKINCFDRVYRLSDYAKEVRLSQVGEVIDDHYKRTLQDIQNEDILFYNKNKKFNIASRVLVSSIEPIIYMVFMYQIIVSRTISISGLGLALSSFWGLRWSLQDVIGKIGNLAEHGMYIGKLREFLDAEYDEDNHNKQIAEPFESLVLNDVSFGYDSSKIVLHNINMEIKKGEKIAIVGYNGAGKTTLIKLLLNLYEPKSGKILYNGEDIGKYKKESYRLRFGVMFQNSNIYAATIAENISCDSFQESLKNRVLDAIRCSEFSYKLEELPGGIYTELTKEFNEAGINVSGGEAQRITIARLFFSDKDFIIMDEPSSALDPIAEERIYRNLNYYFRNKTMLTISHRLSTTKDADRIYVMNNGMFSEVGNHDELMKLGGDYAQMFSVQSQKYQK